MINVSVFEGSRKSEVGSRKGKQKKQQATMQQQPLPLSNFVQVSRARPGRAQRWRESVTSNIEHRTSNIFKLPLLLTIALASTGCVSTYVGPPPASQSPSATPRSAPVEEIGKVEPTAPVTTAPEPTVQIRPGSDQSYRSSRAIDGLLSDGWKLFEQQRYDASVSVAERALRIDRRNPEVYLLLARSYLLQSQPALAKQFARQGLAFANSSEPVYRQLQELLQRR